MRNMAPCGGASRDSSFPRLPSAVASPCFPSINESTVSPNVSFRVPPQQAVDRSLPCLNLGKVVNRSGCNCPMKFIHECEIHQFCHRGSHYSTVASCLTCPDYESDRP